MNPITSNRFHIFPRRRAFTLIELLVVISVIALLAAFTISGLKMIGVSKKISTASGELHELTLAIEQYHSAYGVYPPGNALNTDSSSLINPLYYELTGVTTNVSSGYQTVGTNTITAASFTTVFGGAGILNCTKGSGEDVKNSENFLAGLKANRVGTANIGGVPVNMLVTSVGGPDDAYLPVGTQGVNPFRYKAPSPTNQNPNSYDLWIELSMGATNFGGPPGGSNNVRLISNWAKGSQKASQMP